MIATIFDFNGVLVDDEHVHLEAFREVLRPRRVTVTDEAYAERYLGFDDAGAFRAMLTDHGKPPSDEEVRALVAAKKPVYMERIAGSLKVFPGAAELVRRRASLGIAGIVSGALEPEIRFCLEQMGVLGEIAFIVAAEHTRACKPDPEGYHLGKAELAKRVGSSHAVVIEDSLAGIQAAKAANLRCVAVAHSYAAEQLAQAGADAVGPDLASLTDEVLDGGAR